MIETPHETAINPMHVFEVAKPQPTVEKQWLVAVVTSYGEEISYTFDDRTKAQTFYNLVSRFSPFAS